MKRMASNEKNVVDPVVSYHSRSPSPLGAQGNSEELKRIRFAMGLRDFSKKRGGAERYLVDLCNRMATEGFEVHVYAEHWDEEDQKICFHSVKTIPFPKSLQLLSFAIKATKEIENGNYDITFGVGNTLKADVLQPHGGVHWAWFWKSLRAYENPIVWTIKFLGRILSPKQWVSGWIEDVPYKRKKFSKIIAISEMVKEDMMQWYQIPEDRIKVVYNGVDTERFNPQNRKYRDEIRKRYGIEDEFILLFVSNNFRMKGLGYLIKALAKMKKGNYPSFKLFVLGGDHQAPYRRLAHKTGVCDKVLFIGRTDEPEKYYGASDFLVHPTFYDACSLTVLEALASGLPVITTHFNGASGMITQSREGWVMSDPRDDQALVEKISFYLNHDRIEKSSIVARHLAESYSLERNWREMDGVFRKSLLGGRTSG